MKTYLILSLERKFIDSKIKEITRLQKISPFDITDFDSDISLGIDEVRKIIKQSIERPFSGNFKLTVIRNFHLSSFEAQNSLLKFLEEHPQFLTIILIAENEQNILPTVLSRSEIIRNPGQKKIQIIDLDILLKKSIGQRLFYIQKTITGKDQAIIFLKNLINSLEIALLNDDRQNSVKLPKNEFGLMIKKSEKARLYLENNLNYKMVLDVLVMGFPLITPVG